MCGHYSFRDLSKERISRYRVIMFQMKIAVSRTVACAAALLLPLGANALSLGFRTDTVLMHIPAKDVNDFKSFISQSLNDGEAGKLREWSSSARTSKYPVKVQLTPGAVVETRSAGQCRLLSADVSQRNRVESWRIWFCKQSDGAWKISGLE